MFNVSTRRKFIRPASFMATASVAALLSACGGGTGTAQYSIDSSGNLTSAKATTTMANGSTQSTAISSTPSSTSGGTSTTTTTGTTSTTTPSTGASAGTSSGTTSSVSTGTTAGTSSSPSTSTTTGVATTTSAATGSTLMPFGQTGSYTLTFNDEFDTFNTAKWNDAIWYETSNATKNYAVSNGTLKIWPQRDASGKFFNRTIDTDRKYYQTYGFFEIEAKLPIGKGTWPAFWLFNHIGTRRPEIDIMEAYAGGGPNSGWSDANLHPTAYAPTVWIDAGKLAGTKTILTPDLSAAFHKYAVKWEAGKQTFYFDGKQVFTLNVAMPDPMYIMLDLWFGSASGQPDGTTPVGIGNSYEVNYVRAWKIN